MSDSLTHAGRRAEAVRLQPGAIVRAPSPRAARARRLRFAQSTPRPIRMRERTFRSWPTSECSRPSPCGAVHRISRSDRMACGGPPLPWNRGPHVTVHPTPGIGGICTQRAHVTDGVNGDGEEKILTRETREWGRKDPQVQEEQPTEDASLRSRSRSHGLPFLDVVPRPARVRSTHR